MHKHICKSFAEKIKLKSPAKSCSFKTESAVWFAMELADMKIQLTVITIDSTQLLQGIGVLHKENDLILVYRYMIEIKYLSCYTLS